MERSEYIDSSMICLLSLIALVLFSFCNSNPTEVGSTDQNEINGDPDPTFNEISLITTDDGLVRSQVYALAVCPNNDVWFGYGPNGNGITKMAGSEVVSYTENEGLSNNNVHALECDSKGRLWIGYGANAGGLTVLNNNEWKNYTTEDGLHSNNIFSIAVSDEDEIWISYGAQRSGVTYIR